MSDTDWSDVFFSAFVMIALVMMTITAWIKVSQAVSVKIWGEGDPKNPSLIPYIAVAIFISALSLIIVASIHNLSSINLQLPVRPE
jgi:hypothetical protein